jgi:signal transduction histidine kinase
MTTPPVRLTPEILVSRLGEYLVSKKVITQIDLNSGLQEQKRLKEAGQPTVIGQVLVQMGLLDRNALDEAVTELIFKLRTALQETNQQLERRVQERTAELQEALKKLSEVSQLKSNIIANVSHEFRTPMTHLKGYLDLLQSETLGPVNPEQLDALKVMQKASDRLEGLIEDLIRFSTMSKGEFTLILDPLDLLSIFKNVTAHAAEKAAEHTIKIRYGLPENIPIVKGDNEKISWVLAQLLDNAIKFTDGGGKVMLSAEIDGQLVKIAVTDTGIGIPSERIPELFEPFRQLDGSATRRFGGTGLGLALVRQIIEAHGSTIRVYSKVGQGSRFEFTLPRDEETDPANR